MTSLSEKFSLNATGHRSPRQLSYEGPNPGPQAQTGHIHVPRLEEATHVALSPKLDLQRELDLAPALRQAAEAAQDKRKKKQTRMCSRPPALSLQAPESGGLKPGWPGSTRQGSSSPSLPQPDSPYGLAVPSPFYASSGATGSAGALSGYSSWSAGTSASHLAQDRPSKRSSAATVAHRLQQATSSFDEILQQMQGQDTQYASAVHRAQQLAQCVQRRLKRVVQAKDAGEPSFQYHRYIDEAALSSLKYFAVMVTHLTHKEKDPVSFNAGGEMSMLCTGLQAVNTELGAPVLLLRCVSQSVDNKKRIDSWFKKSNDLSISLPAFANTLPDPRNKNVEADKDTWDTVANYWGQSRAVANSLVHAPFDYTEVQKAIDAWEAMQASAIERSMACL